MNLYPNDLEENIWIRSKAKAWLRSGLISSKQGEAIQSASSIDVLQANLFIRLLLFGFTVLGLAALVGCFLWFTKIREHAALARVLFVFGVSSYGLAEFGVRRYRFYRYGVEEALALGAVMFMGVATICGINDAKLGSAANAVILAGVVGTGALWLYRRFGFLYAAVIAILALATLPFHFSLSSVLERVVLVALFAVAYMFLQRLQAKCDLAFRRKIYDVLQVLCLCGAYWSMNLRLADLRFAGFNPAALNLSPRLPYADFPPLFYWLSYGFIFFLPIAILYYGLHLRKRLLIDAGIVMGVMTLVTNKDYLGLAHYPWDPAILGSLLAGLSLILLRWLAQGPGKERQGYTSQEIVKPESHSLDLQAAGLALHTSDTGHAPDQPSGGRGGGFSGGGASGEF